MTAVATGMVSVAGRATRLPSAAPAAAGSPAAAGADEPGEHEGPEQERQEREEPAVRRAATEYPEDDPQRDQGRDHHRRRQQRPPVRPRGCAALGRRPRLLQRGKVGERAAQVLAGARAERGLRPLGELLPGQAPVDVMALQQLHGLLAVRVGHADLRSLVPIHVDLSPSPLVVLCSQLVVPCLYVDDRAAELTCRHTSDGFASTPVGAGSGAVRAPVTTGPLAPAYRTTCARPPGLGVGCPPRPRGGTIQAWSATGPKPMENGERISTTPGTRTSWTRVPASTCWWSWRTGGRCSSWASGPAASRCRWRGAAWRSTGSMPPRRCWSTFAPSPAGTASTPISETWARSPSMPSSGWYSWPRTRSSCSLPRTSRSAVSRRWPAG